MLEKAGRLGQVKIQGFLANEIKHRLSLKSAQASAVKFDRTGIARRKLPGAWVQS